MYICIAVNTDMYCCTTMKIDSNSSKPAGPLFKTTSSSYCAYSQREQIRNPVFNHVHIYTYSTYIVHECNSSGYNHFGCVRMTACMYVTCSILYLILLYVFSQEMSSMEHQVHDVGMTPFGRHK